MPNLLRKIPFTEELLVAVQDFDCGDEVWEQPLAAWIKSAPNIKSGALYDIAKRKLEVWLHINGANELVGYSSLGPSRWEWPTRDVQNSH